MVPSRKAEQRQVTQSGLAHLITLSKFRLSHLSPFGHPGPKPRIDGADGADAPRRHRKPDE